MNGNDVIKVTAEEDGVVIETEYDKIFVGWEVVDMIAEVSEEHYRKKMMEDFKNIVVMNDQKKIN